MGQQQTSCPQHTNPINSQYLQTGMKHPSADLYIWTADLCNCQHADQKHGNELYGDDLHLIPYLIRGKTGEGQYEQLEIH